MKTGSWRGAISTCCRAALPRAEGVILPTVGHQPHLTHGKPWPSLIGDWLLPCAPAGCSEEHRLEVRCGHLPVQREPSATGPLPASGRSNDE